ncbi:MAG: hypothetical protein ABI903_00600 [Actinomycetota bacterium]
MQGFLGMAAFVATCAGIVWVRNLFWKAAKQKVLDRKDRARGQSAIKSQMAFVIPAIGASDVIRTVVAGLGYPTTKPAQAAAMVLIGATDCQAAFALANKFGQTWESRLSVVDGPDGAHGDYEVVRWTMSDGVASGWEEMQILQRRVGEIATGIGGTVKVTVPVTGH